MVSEEATTVEDKVNSSIIADDVTSSFFFYRIPVVLRYRVSDADCSLGINTPISNYSAGRPRAPPPPDAPPSNVLGVFGLSIRTTERDLQDEFSRFGSVETIVIVYDQQTERSRGFGFVTMRDISEAERCIAEINGLVSSSLRVLSVPSASYS